METHTLLSGKQVKLGKNDPKFDRRTLQLPKYLHSTLPETAAARDLTSELPWDDDVLGNDEYGCCTCAALGHMIRLLQQTTDLPVTVTTEGVLAAYSAITGFRRDDPSTDNGANMLDVLKYARRSGICGVKLQAFMSFDPRDRALMRAAIDLFGGAYLGVALPTTAQSQDIWDAVSETVPGSWGGHAVSAVSTSPIIDCINTWGGKQPLTPSFLTQCADEAYAILWEGLPPPAGLDMATLNADLAGL
jgi:hypothetical protein